MTKRVHAFLVAICAVAVLFGAVSIYARNYGNDPAYQKKIDSEGRTLRKHEKELVRKELASLALGIAKKNPKYRERIRLKHPVRKTYDQYTMDCSGFVSAVYTIANVRVFEKQAALIAGANGVLILHETLAKFDKTYRRTRPGKGDIVFFDNTYDRNKNGKHDDELLHTGIVIDVDSRGTIRYVHSSVSKGVSIAYANFDHPERWKDGSYIFNTPLRRRRNTDPRGMKYYSSSLIHDFGTVLDIPTNGKRF